MGSNPVLMIIFVHNQAQTLFLDDWSIAALAFPRDYEKCRISSQTQDLINQNLCFNKIFHWFNTHWSLRSTTLCVTCYLYIYIYIICRLQCKWFWWWWLWQWRWYSGDHVGNCGGFGGHGGCGGGGGIYHPTAQVLLYKGNTTSVQKDCWKEIINKMRKLYLPELLWGEFYAFEKKILINHLNEK